MSKDQQMLTDEQKAKFCSLMMEKYKIEVNIKDEMLPTFYVAYQSALLSQESAKMMEALAKRNDEELRQMVLNFDNNLNNQLEKFNTRLKKVETKQYRFDSPNIAFMFSFGYYGLPILGVALFLFLSFVFYQYQVIPQQREAYLRHWIDAGDYAEVSRGNTTISTIRLFEAEDFIHAVAGKNYVYNEECKCIEVPLYYETRK